MVLDRMSPRRIQVSILLVLLLLGLTTASEDIQEETEEEEDPPFCTSSESQKYEDEDEDGLAQDDGPPCVELPSDEPTDAREDEEKMTMSESETDYELADSESLPGELRTHLVSHFTLHSVECKCQCVNLYSASSAKLPICARRVSTVQTAAPSCFRAAKLSSIYFVLYFC